MTTPTPQDTMLEVRRFGIPDGLPPDRWAPWQKKWNAKRRKWDKIPWRGLSTTKPQDWLRLGDALSGYERGSYDGVGLCVTGLKTIISIDIDRCVENGVLSETAQRIVAGAGTYAELSPSGRGIRIFGKGTIPRDWTNHEVGVEVYGGNQARFLTVTGHRLPGSPAEVRDIPPEFLVELEKEFAREHLTADVISVGEPAVLDEMLLPDVARLDLPAACAAFLARGEAGADRSRTAFGAAVALQAAGLSQQEAFSVLWKNEHARDVALSHRRGDHDRARAYTWKEWVCKATPKAEAATVKAEDFPVIPQEERGVEGPKVERAKSGKIEPTAPNLLAMLRRADVVGFSLRYDAFQDDIAIAWRGAWRSMRETDYTRIKEHLETGEVSFKAIEKSLLRDCMWLVAEENEFDSARAWLEPLQWDGVPRVERFLARYFATEDSDYTRGCSRLLWTALAGRVMDPGCQLDYVVTLIGAQGVGKSRGVTAMAPEPQFCVEINLSERDDDMSRLLRGALIGEISELRGLHSKGQDSVKAWITRRYEEWTPKYQERKHRFWRRCVFIGTTNEREFLSDDTGNRRHCPVEVMGKVDLEAIVADRDQLWAEARELWRLGGVAWQGVEELAATKHAAHMITDPWQLAIEQWLDEPDPMTGKIPRELAFIRTIDVARDCLHIEDKHFKRGDEMRIGRALTSCGFDRVQRRFGTARHWVYVTSSHLSLTEGGDPLTL